MSLHGTRLFVSAATARALQSVCHKNNEGVSLYQQGRCVEAVNSLKEAVSTTKAFLKQCLDVEEGTPTVFELCISLQVMPSKMDNQASDIDSFVDSTVYSKLFKIEVILLSDAEASLQQQMMQGDGNDGEPCLLFSILSSMLIFNFALAHHSLAITSREGNVTGTRNFLSKSLVLYGLAYKSLHGELRHEIIDPDMLQLLVQAILNNLGQCYATLDDTENFKACCKLLLRRIFLFQHHQSRTGNIGSNEDRNSDDQSIAFFLKNALFLILKDRGFAPAA
ncbi:hypothetical protein IV203_030546 [Nitzschia inconspicua]|uniref:Uncharacterized protein n=1 Tax=Nitzschia inconspicua TaxID=303405 RepID=A0A9K3PBN8_9STRA|nr:hypothetical protein IV203_022882 [Nitzschia inconspicua]KAG7367803.1 hypothetical protein IV203_030546 [Nitzschia inconspicua]